MFWKWSPVAHNRSTYSKWSLEFPNIIMNSVSNKAHTKLLKGCQRIIYTYRFHFCCKVHTVEFNINYIFYLYLNSPRRESLCVHCSFLCLSQYIVTCLFSYFHSLSLLFTSNQPLFLSRRGNREEAHSLQERKQVLEDAHLLSGEE